MIWTNEEGSLYPPAMMCSGIVSNDYMPPTTMIFASFEKGLSHCEPEHTSDAVCTEAAGADVLELNFSCPQMVEHGMGSDVGQNPDLVRRYTKAVIDATTLPVLAKLTPNTGSMVRAAEAALAGGANGLAACRLPPRLCSMGIVLLMI